VNKGTNLVLVRSTQIQNMITDGIMSEQIHINIIRVQKVILSQYGTIEGKRIKLAHRLYLNKSSGIFSPQKRIKPMKITNPFRKKTLILMNQMQFASRNTWAEKHSKESGDVKKFHDQMNFYLARLSRWNRIAGTCELPLHYAYKIRNKIRRFFP